MKKYVWLNPIVMSSYSFLTLIISLNRRGYIAVFPEENHASKILNKYNNLTKNDKPILDQRCPLITRYFKLKNIDVNYYNIDPILISISKELAKRDDLKNGVKFITTPCVSLALMGNNLKLKNTIFLTWDFFYSLNKLNINGKSLKNSPIPLGFFDSISDNILKLTGDFDIENLNSFDIIEGLFCENGCHNGNGVECI